MPDSITIPSFCLEINQQRLSNEMAAAVEEIKLEEELNVPAMLTIKLNAFDNEKGKWQWLDLQAVKPGDEIKVGLGMTAVEWLMAGDVISVNADLKEYAAVEIRVYDRLHRLRFGSKQRSFTDITDSDLASQFAGEANLTAEVTATKTKHAYLLQNNQSNYQFLLQRARRIGYELLANEKKLIFRPVPAKQKPEVTLEMDKNLESFKTEMKAPTKGSKVEVRGWDIMTKDIISAKADGNSFEKMNPGKKSGHELVKDFGSTEISIFDHQLSDAAEAEVVAKAYYRSFLVDFINGEGQCGGDPKVRAGKTVEIKGTNNFDGIYYIVSTVHTLRREECYITTFKVKGTEI